MRSKLHPGQRVVCVAEIPDHFIHPGDRDLILPKLGNLYTVRDTEVGWGGAREVAGVRLVEIVNPIKNYRSGPNEITQMEKFFAESYFSPLRDLSVFRDMLTRTPVEGYGEILMLDLEDTLSHLSGGDDK